jgi:hypothetical protein
MLHIINNKIKKAMEGFDASYREAYREGNYLYSLCEWSFYLPHMLIATYLFYWSAHNCPYVLPFLLPVNFHVFLAFEAFGPGATKLRESMRAQFGKERELSSYIIGAVVLHVIFHAGMWLFCEFLKSWIS